MKKTKKHRRKDGRWQKKNAEELLTSPEGLKKRTRWIILAIAVIVVVVGLAIGSLGGRHDGGNTAQIPTPKKTHSERRTRPEYAVIHPPQYSRDHSFNSEAVLVWGGDHEYAEGLRKNQVVSNIRHIDYAGPDSCAKCHEENYDLWSNHAHRWMNVEANEQTVKGDFSGGPAARINYRGGTGEFFQKGGSFMMRLSRDDVVREFRIKRTLGSRVHQYYIGVLEEGPEEAGHPYRTAEHVLPFGFELTLKDWIPIVHAKGQGGSDSERDDPFERPSQLRYDVNCSMCHTTQPMGNLMLAMFKRFAAYSPRKIHFEASNYIDETNPGAVRLELPEGQSLNARNVKPFVNAITLQAHELIKPENAVTLGISCEACHLGSVAHVNNEDDKPLFFPSGSHVFAEGASDSGVWGRNTANKNFICARCHSGSRPQYAAGMATWNSTEYSDALRGHCYQPAKAKARGMNVLTCVTCHNPHETIGRRWKKTVEQDRDSCVKCHPHYANPVVAQSHTRHPASSSGSQCMNCHMPKINEGIGDMVRTHTIFKPTNVKMLEANQPNACNMCHVKESIDWTLQHLVQWYGLGSKETSPDSSTRGYSSVAIDKNYPNRTGSAALGWLQSPHLGTRMVGADVLLKAKADWALPQLLKTLDDPYMESRQFTVQRLRDYFDINTDDFGYKLYMTKDERKEPIVRMLDELAPNPSNELRPGGE